MEKMTNFWKFSLHFESFLWWKKYHFCFDHPPHILYLFFFEGCLCSFPCFISFKGCGPWRRVRHVPQRTTWHPATDSLMLGHTEQGQVFYSCEILVFLDLMMSVSMTSLWGHGWSGWYWKVWLADWLLFLELLSQLITRNFRLSSNLTCRGTDQYGSPSDDGAPWSIRWALDQFDEFLFASGDFQYWMIVSKGRVHLILYCNLLD